MEDLKTIPGRVREAASELYTTRKTLHTTSPEWADALPENFPHLHVRFYDKTRSALQAVGFRFLADVEDQRLSRMFPESRTFVRVLIGPEGMILASMHQSRRAGRARMQAIELEKFTSINAIEFMTEFTDGAFVITSNIKGHGYECSTRPDQVTLQRMGQHASLEELLKTHYGAILAKRQRDPDVSPLVLRDRRDVESSGRRERAIWSAFYKSIGYVDEDAEFAKWREQYGSAIAHLLVAAICELKRKDG